MYLLFLLVLFAAIGYFLAGSRLGDKVDQTTDKLSTSSRNWADRVEDKFSTMINKRTKKDSFRVWVAGPGSESFLDEFKIWLAGLSDQEAQSFSHGLEDYANGLGFNLHMLMEGSLDRQPVLRQVFVETIVVYSQAFRKAKQARKEAESADQEQVKAPVTEPASGNGKKTAGKRSNHHKDSVPAEASNSASTA